jgi:DNA-dependent RNA polymerase auxiliary subunit epsilon
MSNFNTEFSTETSLFTNRKSTRKLRQSQEDQTQKAEKITALSDGNVASTSTLCKVDG